MTMRTRGILKAAAAAGVLASGLTVGLRPVGAAAQEMEVGMREFILRCAACHGPRGQGDGPVAPMLKQQPKDLRHLARENDGRFPFVEVYQAIDGRREIRGHGSTEMPVWGDYFEEEAVARALPPGLDARQIVQGRILSLVYYLQAIQQR
jgi:mono/diheme cytochrome c family protein